jgi:tetratricopeptide (TPR) repeat protein
MILISTAILGLTLLAPPQQVPDQRAEAERLANSGAYEAALKQFQALAAANPEDIPARLWIARLHAKLGHPEHAGEVYRSILAVQPDNLEALIGLGNSLVALDRLDDASDALSRAEKLAGDRPEVLAAQGRLHAAANHTTLALAYYERALTIDPSNQDVRAQADALRAARAHRLELDYDFQHANVEVDDSHVGTFIFNARAGDAVRVVVEGQVESLFGVTDQRAGGGFEFALSRNTRLNVGGLAGFDPVYLPESDFYGQLGYTNRRATWGVLFRRAGFKDDADFWIAGPELTMRFSDSFEAFIAYYRGNTTQVGLEEVATDNVAIRLSGAVTKGFRLGVGYTHGIDRLDWLTVDRIGFESDTFALRANMIFTPFVSLEVGYDFQQRPADVNISRARAGLTCRF